MYAVVEAGGKQYRVTVGDKIRVEKCAAKEGTQITLPNVLVLGKDSAAEFGTPFVAGANVTAKVLGHGKEDKVIVFKYKRKKNYRRFRGHRQHFTDLIVEAITG